MWTNFADNGKIHTCMYNVCTMYTTAVGVILPRQLACCLHRNEYDIWCNVCWTLVWGGIIGKLFEGNCWRGNAGGKVLGSLRSHGTRDKGWSIIDRCYRERVIVEAFCSLRSHGTRFAYGRVRAQALSLPCLVMGKAGVCACVVIS